MRVTPGIEKLRDMGYRVRRIPRPELPMSLENYEFYELYIGGQKVWNNQDRYGWFTIGELNLYAAKVPGVKQASMEDLLYAPF